MALVTLRTPSTLDLPPGFRTVALRESGDAFAHACRTAGEEGAGTLVWVRRFDMAEFAVVLEPEEPLAEARKAFFMGMAATADAIASLCPPERSVGIAFPDTIRFDGGLVGGGRLGWPKRCAEDQVPDWLVFSACVRVSFAGLMEPGKVPNATALDEEGFEGVGPAMLVEAFARFLMRFVDIWQNEGPDRILKDYMKRLDKDRPGDTLALSPEGDLVVTPAAGGIGRTLSLLDGLKAVAWLDRDAEGRACDDAADHPARSDTFVFPLAAEPGEWAVTGSFLFWGRDVGSLAGKERAAFRSGFVGVDSLGFSTLVVCQPIKPEERAAAVEALAAHLVAKLGAPSLDAARAAAEEEIAFASSLAEHDEGTLVALHRGEEDGEIREQYRVLQRRERTEGADSLHAHARAFTFHEEVDDMPEERVGT